MKNQFSLQEINAISEMAFLKAVEFMNKEAGITEGDTAALIFSGHERDLIVETFAKYLSSATR